MWKPLKIQEAIVGSIPVDVLGVVTVRPWADEGLQHERGDLVRRLAPARAAVQIDQSVALTIESSAERDRLLVLTLLAGATVRAERAHTPERADLVAAVTDDWSPAFRGHVTKPPFRCNGPLPTAGMALPSP
jgi:hypothetical protein